MAKAKKKVAKKAAKKNGRKQAGTKRGAKASASKRRVKKAARAPRRRRKPERLRRRNQRRRNRRRKKRQRSRRKNPRKNAKTVERRTVPSKAKARFAATPPVVEAVAKEIKKETVKICVKAKAAPRAAIPPTPAAKNSFYITTAIAYPNGAPHIGHAYEAIATDALARFQRLDGKDVFFLTGTDEHGLKMIQTAQKENMTPAQLAARNAAQFREMDERLNVSFDRFIRTSEEQHHRSGPGDLEADGSRMATSISTAMPAGIRCATRPITPRTKPSSAKTMCGAGRRARRSNGSRRRAISSGSPPIRTSFWRSTRTSRISSVRTRAGTRSSASSRAG